MEFRVLGPLEVLDDGRPIPLATPKYRTLLAILLLNANQAVSTDRLVDFLWPDGPPTTATNLVHGYVAKVRRLLQPDAAPAAASILLTRPPGYLLRVADGELDLHRFEHLLAEAEEAMQQRAFQAAATQLGAALALWRGPALADVPALGLRQAEGARLEELRLTALERRVDAHLALGRHDRLVAELAALSVTYPLRERFRGQLMLALYRSGRQGEALQAYRTFRDMLVEELGVEPTPELQRLQHAILAADPTLATLQPDGPVTAHPAAQPTAGSDERPAGPPGRPNQLPASIADFTGRAALLDRLASRLAGARQSATATLVTIAGPAGIGKTALAVHAAHQARSLFPDGQLFAHLHGAEGRPLDPADVLVDFLRALGVDGGAIPAGLDARASLYRSRLADRRVLVLLDDAAGEAQIRPLLPGDPTTAVVVTSRATLAALAATETLRLAELPAHDAVELLAKIAGCDRRAAEPDAAQEIVRLCGCLPLAVRIAGAKLAARPTLPLSSLAARLRDERHRLDELVSGDLAVRASLALSYRALEAPVQRAFRLLGLLDVTEFPDWIVAALLDAPLPTGEALVERLVDAQLAQFVRVDQTGRCRYRLHDLVRVYARDRLHAEEPPHQRRSALRRALCSYLELAVAALDTLPECTPRISPRPQPTRWRYAPVDPVVVTGADVLAWFSTEHANLVSAVTTAARDDVPTLAVDLANLLILPCWVSGRFDDWQRTATVAHQVAVRQDDALGEAWALWNLGTLWTDQARTDEAVACLHAARQRHARLGHRSGEAWSLQALADAHLYQGQLDKAAGCARKAQLIFEEIAEDHGLAYVLRSLGNVFVLQGKPSQAVDVLQRCLAIFRSAEDRLGLSCALQMLGRAWTQQGRRDRAIACYEEALEFCDQMGDRTGRCYVLRSLADAYREQGRLGEAETCLSTLVPAFRELGIQRGVAETLHSLGGVRRAQGRNRQATTCLAECAELFHELGEGLWEATALAQLSRAQRATGETEQATATWTAARSLLDELGVDQPGSIGGWSEPFVE
jgi:DNA-binding SARP family transcriptional activator/tetratricopeptide (TPR) repeat protein